MQEFFVIGAFVELFTVIILFKFFWLRCTARKKLGIYDVHKSSNAGYLVSNNRQMKQSTHHLVNVPVTQVDSISFNCIHI